MLLIHADDGLDRAFGRRSKTMTSEVSVGLALVMAGWSAEELVPWELRLPSG